MKHIPVLAHALERDLDLLLIEELACSPDFVAWLLNKATGQSHRDLRKSEVLHSTRRMFNRREIDISVRAETDVGQYLLLLENKLDAGQQPGQAQSYREEAEACAAPDLKVLTGLTCPRAYALSHESFARAFDFRIVYEDIERYFISRARETSPDIARRLSYRAELVRQAIGKERRGYRQVVHPARGAFAERYVAAVAQLAPELIPGPSMLRESAAESVTMIFAPETLPSWHFLPAMRLVHQLRDGNANLNFYTWGDRFEILASLMAPAIDGTGFRVEQTMNRRKGGRTSLKIVADTPFVDLFGDFTAQEAAIQAGIHAANALRNWLLAHERDVRSWSETVSGL